MDASQFLNERVDSAFQSFPDQSITLGQQHSTSYPSLNSNIATTQRHNKQTRKPKRKSRSPTIHLSDTESQQRFEDQIDMSMDDEEQSSEPSDSRTQAYSSQRSKHSSPKSSAEPSVDDRRIRRQIANCNERRRMQSINAGFAALRQYLPQRCGEKLSKAAILQQTAELIQTLQLEKSRHTSGERGIKCTSDEEVNPDSDRPQCKKRRTVIKHEPKEQRIEGSEKSFDHAGAQVADYNKIIEELRASLGKEQQLRLLYEQKFAELKSTLSASLGFSSMPVNLNQNETQQLVHQQRSSSADGLLAPKNDTQSPAFQYNPPLTNEVAYGMRMPRPSNVGNLAAALLSPNHLGTSSFSPLLAQQILSSQMSPISYLLSMLQTNYDSLPLASPPIPAQHVNQSIVTSSMTNQDAISKIHNVIRQLESDNAKNFPDTLNSDVLVR